jgi:hypothetical protein
MLTVSARCGQDLFIDGIHAALQMPADALQNRSAAAS